ncbi:MAG: hypothetical protein AAF668_15275 [Pseudomonadota bacterium]
MLDLPRLLVVSASLLAFCAIASPVRADQTNAELMDLFDQLEIADVGDAPAIIEKIQSAWSEHDSRTITLLFRRSLVAFENADTGAASQLLDHTISLAPHFAEAFVTRGAVRRATGDVNGATTDLQRAVALEPRHFIALRMLAELHVKEGDDRLAYEYLQQALRIHPKDRGAIAEAQRLLRRIDGQEI